MDELDELMNAPVNEEDERYKEIMNSLSSNQPTQPIQQQPQHNIVQQQPQHHIQQPQQHMQTQHQPQHLQQQQHMQQQHLQQQHLQQQQQQHLQQQHHIQQQHKPPAQTYQQPQQQITSPMQPQQTQQHQSIPSPMQQQQQTQHHPQQQNFQQPQSHMQPKPQAQPQQGGQQPPAQPNPPQPKRTVITLTQAQQQHYLSLPNLQSQQAYLRQIQQQQLQQAQLKAQQQASPQTTQGQQTQPQQTTQQPQQGIQKPMPYGTQPGQQQISIQMKPMANQQYTAAQQQAMIQANLAKQAAQQTTPGGVRPQQQPIVSPQGTITTSAIINGKPTNIQLTPQQYQQFMQQRLQQQQQAAAAAAQQQQGSQPNTTQQTQPQTNTTQYTQQQPVQSTITQQPTQSTITQTQPPQATTPTITQQPPQVTTPTIVQQPPTPTTSVSTPTTQTTSVSTPTTTTVKTKLPSIASPTPTTTPISAPISTTSSVSSIQQQIQQATQAAQQKAAAAAAAAQQTPTISTATSTSSTINNTTTPTTTVPAPGSTTPTSTAKPAAPPNDIQSRVQNHFNALALAYRNAKIEKDVLMEHLVLLFGSSNAANYAKKIDDIPAEKVPPLPKDFDLEVILKKTEELRRMTIEYQASREALNKTPKTNSVSTPGSIQAAVNTTPQLTREQKKEQTKLEREKRKKEKEEKKAQDKKDKEEKKLQHQQQQQQEKKEQQDADNEDDKQNIKDLNDVTKIANIDMKNESDHFLPESNENEEMYTPETEPLFLNSYPLKRKVISIAQKHGLKLSEENILEFISLATQDHLRTILEYLINTSKQRVEMQKDDFPIQITSDAKKQLLAIEKREKDEKMKKEIEEQERLMKEKEQQTKKKSLADDKANANNASKMAKLQILEEKERTMAANKTALDAVGNIGKRKPMQPMMKSSFLLGMNPTAQNIAPPIPNAQLVSFQQLLKEGKTLTPEQETQYQQLKENYDNLLKQYNEKVSGNTSLGISSLYNKDSQSGSIPMDIDGTLPGASNIVGGRAGTQNTKHANRKITKKDCYFSQRLIGHNVLQKYELLKLRKRFNPSVFPF